MLYHHDVSWWHIIVKYDDRSSWDVITIHRRDIPSWYIKMIYHDICICNIYIYIYICVYIVPVNREPGNCESWAVEAFLDAAILAATICRGAGQSWIVIGNYCSESWSSVLGPCQNLYSPSGANLSQFACSQKGWPDNHSHLSHFAGSNSDTANTSPDTLK